MFPQLLGFGAGSAPLVKGSAIDSYATSNRDNYQAVWTGSTGFEVAQCITLGSNKNIWSVEWFLAKFGSPTGTCYATIYNTTGTVGSTAVPTGSVLYTSDTLDVSTLTGTNTLYEFTFPDTPLISAGDIAVGLKYPGGDGSNFVAFGIDTSAPTHAGNMASNENETSWGVPGYDAPFFLYEAI